MAKEVNECFTDDICYNTAEDIIKQLPKINIINQTYIYEKFSVIVIIHISNKFHIVP